MSSKKDEKMENLERNLRLQTAFIKNAHQYFLSREFNPIASPKIVPFKDDEPGHLIRVAVPGKEDEELFLSRSPQLYKEIACLNSQSRRVYEIGSVFRGEFFDNSRRANEFLGLDVELCTDNIPEVIAILKGYLENISEDDKLVRELKKFYPDVNLPKKVIEMTYPAAIRAIGADDLGKKEEKQLSEFLQKEFGTTWAIVTEFPSEGRGFYQINPSTGRSDSFDLISEWEVCSGGLRRRDIAEYKTLLKNIGWSVKEFDKYFDIISKSATNTGGFGIGIERLLGTIINNPDIRGIQPYCRIPGIKIDF